MFLNTHLPPQNYNLFESVTIKHEYKLCEEPVNPVIDCFVATEYPRLDLQFKPFLFVHALFPERTTSFSVNQESVLAAAKEIFSESKSLSPFEGSVLDMTFSRMLKTKPTRKNRI